MTEDRKLIKSISLGMWTVSLYKKNSHYFMNLKEDYDPGLGRKPRFIYFYINDAYIVAPLLRIATELLISALNGEFKNKNENPLF